MSKKSPFLSSVPMRQPRIFIADTAITLKANGPARFIIDQQDISEILMAKFL